MEVCYGRRFVFIEVAPSTPQLCSPRTHPRPRSEHAANHTSPTSTASRLSGAQSLLHFVSSTTPGIDICQSAGCHASELCHLYIQAACAMCSLRRRYTASRSVKTYSYVPTKYLRGTWTSNSFDTSNALWHLRTVYSTNCLYPHFPSTYLCSFYAGTRLGLSQHASLLSMQNHVQGTFALGPRATVAPSRAGLKFRPKNSACRVAFRCTTLAYRRSSRLFCESFLISSIMPCLVSTFACSETLH